MEENMKCKTCGYDAEYDSLKKERDLIWNDRADIIREKDLLKAENNKLKSMIEENAISDTHAPTVINLSTKIAGLSKSNKELNIAIEKLKAEKIKRTELIRAMGISDCLL